MDPLCCESPASNPCAAGAPDAGALGPGRVHAVPHSWLLLRLHLAAGVQVLGDLFEGGTLQVAVLIHKLHGEWEEIE